MAILTVNTLPEKIRISNAKQTFAAGKYGETYAALSGKATYKDPKVQELYDKTAMLYNLEHRWERYQSFIKMEKYDYALNELLVSYGIYSSNIEQAKAMGIEAEYQKFGENVKQALQDKFNVSGEKALEVYNSTTRKKYTIELNQIILDAHLDKASKYKK
jgi:hypothetical protein